MTDSKITALSALTGGNTASTDVYVLVDVSDSSMAASGTDKKQTAAELASTVAQFFNVGAFTSVVISDFTEAAQDVVGGVLISTSTIAFIYNDGANQETAALAVDVYSLPQVIDTVTTTNYTLVLTDAGHLKRLTGATAGTFRIPLNASVGFLVGTHIDMAQANVGQYTISPNAGVTLDATPASPKTTTSALASVIKVATDQWVAGGYLV